MAEDDRLPGAPQRIDVEILGQRYAVRSQAAPDHVRQLVAFVEERVRQIRGSAPGQDPTRFLVLAALDIADELFRLRDEHARAEGDASRRVQALLEVLDSVVKRP